MNIHADELTFFDNNAFIGKHHNPYAESYFGVNILKNAIKESGLSKSMLYHSASVFYDPSYGNQLLIKEAINITGLYLVWIAIPENCYTEIDAENFFSEVEKNNISAIKIFPRYHNFTLINDAIDCLLSYLNEKEVPLLVDQEEISWEELNYILENYSNIPLLLQNTGYRMERYITPLLKKYKNFYFDISRFQVQGGIEFLCSQFGSRQLLFGSGMPIFSPEPIMMMINNARISLQEKQNISSENLSRLLKNVAKF